MHLVIGYRSSIMGNYRDIIRFEKFDMCGYYANRNSMAAVFAKEFESINRQLGSPMKPCPWKVSRSVMHQIKNFFFFCIDI